VGHQQSFAFCSTHWVRSRDHFPVSKNADFLFRHLFLTPSHHHNPTTTAMSLHTPPPTKHRRSAEWHGDGCTRYTRYILFYFSISYCFPPAPSHLSQLCHTQSPNTKNAPFVARFSISAAILCVWWVSCPAPVAANPLTCLTCPLPPAKHKEHAAWGVFHQEKPFFPRDAF